MKTIHFEPLAGDHISSAARVASRHAKRNHAFVRFRFNGVTLVAAPKKSPTTLLWEYDLISGYRADRVRHTKAYRDRESADQQRLLNAQQRVDELIVALPCILEHGSDFDVIIDWLEEFTPLADDMRISFDKDALAAQFESVGFEKDWGVGNPPGWFNTAERMAYYIVGQVINFLRRGMPPHQITVRFCQDYRTVSHSIPLSTKS